MAIVLSYSAGVPIVKVGRIAGQFAKPRSADTELIDGVELPSFRGHIVNDIVPSAAARVPNPDRLLHAYHQSASTLNLLRAFTKGGFADLSRVHAVEPGVRRLQSRGPTLRAARRRDRSGAAVHGRRAASTRDPAQPPRGRLLHEPRGPHPRLRGGAHPSATRSPGGWYDCSAHMLWIGERTRQIDGAHVEFLSWHRQPGRLQGRPVRDRRRGARAVRGAQPRSRSRSPDPDQPHGRRHDRGRPPPLLPACATPVTRSSGPAIRCTATPSPPRAAARRGSSTP